MHRVLKKTGSIYLQMDTRINHWLRIILDDIFGYENFQNELSWCYRSAGFKKNKFSEKHDVILFYTKTKDFIFNLDDVREREISESTQKRFSKQIKKYGNLLTTKGGKKYYTNPYSPPRDWFDINSLSQAHKERTGYPTQKPKELIAKFIKASTNKSAIVADFYMGSGTTAEVCMDLERRFIGCDINEKAFDTAYTRLKKKKMNFFKYKNMKYKIYTFIAFAFLTIGFFCALIAVFYLNPAFIFYGCISVFISSFFVQH